MTEERLTAPGLHAPLTVHRDRCGVAHVGATDEHDAWFGQGFVSAQDRLWQMEYDRRRAAGRWAEVAGRGAVAGDALTRRLQLAGAARADVAAMPAETRAVFQAYAAGVNAYLQSGPPLPLEHHLTGTRSEPWEPWHSVAIFKVRHVLMGTWGQKLAQAQLLARIGPEAYATLHGRPPTGSAVILPPGGAVRRLMETGLDDLRRAAASLGFLAESEGGSNSWAVSGSRTTTGMPVLCNDSHRALDVPSVYWQVHVACPTFNVIGATFPGFPGFPHFGHNGHVAWCITHTSADYQDLYVESFGGDDATQYRVPGGWAPAERRVERIDVAGDGPVEVEAWRTGHGPVVHGDPRTGWALSLRYTATDEPCLAFGVLRPMLLATTVAELHETQRLWVDPVNNLVSADTAGSIGYLTRGYLPIRSSDAHRQFPAPGWTGEHEWTGRVPFEALPQAINPAEGFIATANQAVVEGDEPYIAHQFSPPFRAQRIVEGLTAGRSAPGRPAPGRPAPSRPAPSRPAPGGRLTPEGIAALQGDTTSPAAQRWVSRLARSGPFQGDAERARTMLASWDGNLLPQSNAALLYGHFRRAVAEALFVPLIGQGTWSWLTATEVTTTHGMISRWMANVVYALDGETTPDGRPWGDVLRPALAGAWRKAVAQDGPDPTAWRWQARHTTNARHPLAGRFPEHAGRLNPPAVAVGGDGDTIQAASYLWGDRPAFAIVGLSVYRQVVDLGDIAHASYVIPGGVSGEPGSAHFGDQLERWRTHQRIPMHYTPEEVRAAAVHSLTLTPD